MAGFNEKRSVVVVGVTGCGKSTICNKILGEEVFKVAQGFQTVTTAVECKGKSIDILGQTMDVTVLDTIGLSDAHGNSLDSMMEIKDKIKQIGGINLVLFVIRLGRLTDAEVSALKLIEENMKQSIGIFSAAVITGCENLDAEGRKKTIEEFKSDRITGKFASMLQLGVHTVGFPDIKTYPEQIRSIFTEIAKKDTQELHKLVYRAGLQYSYDQVFTIGCVENLSLTWQAVKVIFMRQ